MGPGIALMALLSLTGTILVTDPFKTEARTSITGVIFAVTSAITAALAHTTLRTIATKVRFLASVLSFSVFTILVGIAAGGTIDLFRSASNMEIAVAAALFAYFEQCAMSKGYEYCTAGKGALVGVIELRLAYVLGIAFLGEIPNLVSVVGGILILAATLIIVYEAMANERQRDMNQGCYYACAAADSTREHH